MKFFKQSILGAYLTLLFGTASKPVQTSAQSFEPWGKSVGSSGPERVVFTDDTGADPTADMIQRRADNCETVNTIISSIGTSSSVVAYCTFGGLTSRYVCRHYFHGNTCDELALIIASGIWVVFSALHDTGAIGRRDTGKSLAELLAARWEDEGIVFESISDKSNNLQARYTSSERKPLQMAGVKGLEFGNSTHDMDIFYFGDGDGHVYLPMGRQTEKGDKSKREAHDGPGFKISYTARLPSQLSKQHKVDMSQSIALEWASRANDGMHDMIGFVETEHDANFYYRIIPETEGYGLNYESVDICGGMGKFL